VHNRNPNPSNPPPMQQQPMMPLAAKLPGQPQPMIRPTTQPLPSLQPQQPLLPPMQQQPHGNYPMWGTSPQPRASAQDLMMEQQRPVLPSRASNPALPAKDNPRRMSGLQPWMRIGRSMRLFGARTQPGRGENRTG